MQLCYCKKCGRIILFVLEDEERVCDCCKSQVFPIPENFLRNECTIKEELEKQFINEYIKTSPEYDPNWAKKKEDILTKPKGHGIIFSNSTSTQNTGAPTCPTCHSTNLSKISGTSRWLSVGLFGLASSKIGKTFKCNSCGYTW